MSSTLLGYSSSLKHKLHEDKAPCLFVDFFFPITKIIVQNIAYTL